MRRDRRQAPSVRSRAPGAAQRTVRSRASIRLQGPRARVWGARAQILWPPPAAGLMPPPWRRRLALVSTARRHCHLPARLPFSWAAIARHEVRELPDRRADRAALREGPQRVRQSAAGGPALGVAAGPLSAGASVHSRLPAAAAPWQLPAAWHGWP